MAYGVIRTSTEAQPGGSRKLISGVTCRTLPRHFVSDLAYDPRPLTLPTGKHALGLSSANPLSIPLPGDLFDHSLWVAYLPSADFSNKIRQGAEF